MHGSQNDQRMRDERTRCSTKQCMQPGIQFHSSYRSTTYALERASGQVGLFRLKHGLQGHLIGAQFYGRKNPKNTCREKRDLKPDEKNSCVSVSSCPCRCHSSRAGKTEVIAAVRLCIRQKTVKPHTAAHSLTSTRPTCET